MSVGQNYEQHRIAKEGEKTCDTCLSFNGSNCDNCDTQVGHTFEHNTCNYHLGEREEVCDPKTKEEKISRNRARMNSILLNDRLYPIEKKVLIKEIAKTNDRLIKELLEESKRVR